LVSELREVSRAEIVAEKGAFSNWVEEIVRRVEGNAPRRDFRWIFTSDRFSGDWQELQGIHAERRGRRQIARAWQARAIRAVARHALRIPFRCLHATGGRAMKSCRIRWDYREKKITGARAANSMCEKTKRHSIAAPVNF